MSRVRPHLLSITCHDLGRHLGCYGIGTVHSPSVDRLAAEGIRFDRAFCAAPQCSPSRAALATGRWPHCNGVMGLTHGGFGWDLAADELPVAALLGSHGYTTHLFGLQHVTRELGRLGFAHTHATGTGDAGATHAQTGDVVAAAFEEVLPGAVRGAEGGPLYLEVNLFEPHRPYDYGGTLPDTEGGVWVPPYLPAIPEAEEEMAALQGSIRKADETVGRILRALEEAGIAEDTLVVFSADHGIAMPRAKCTLYDPGIGIALLVRWPAGGVAGGSETGSLVSNLDVLPALLEAASVPVPDRVQGRSLLGLARGSGAGHDAVFAEKTFHNYYDPMRCVRTERFKLIRNFESSFAVEVPGDIQQGAIFRADPGRYSTNRPSMVELYDLERDPLEQENLAGRPETAGVEGTLDARLWHWMESTQDPLLEAPIGSPAYTLALRR